MPLAAWTFVLHFSPTQSLSARKGRAAHHQNDISPLKISNINLPDFLLEFFIGVFISNYVVLNKKGFKPKYQININLPDFSHLTALTENKHILAHLVGCLSRRLLDFREMGSVIAAASRPQQQGAPAPARRAARDGGMPASWPECTHACGFKALSRELSPTATT